MPSSITLAFDPPADTENEYIWPSAIDPRVVEPALMLIDPYPWSAPLEDVKVRKR